MRFPASRVQGFRIHSSRFQVKGLEIEGLGIRVLASRDSGWGVWRTG